MEDQTDAQIETAIAALEAQRPVVGDSAVATAIAVLSQTLADRRARRDEQQLKTATILFLDVVSSTRLTQYLDPEDVHAVMDTALDRLTAIVCLYQGRVLNYAGDSLLAVFGADQALEDDAERAVRAGLAMLAESPVLAAEFRERLGLESFAVRVGVHTGPVLLGGGINFEGNIRGVSVNIAARMEQTAPVGGLRISHDTYHHVRGRFDIEPQPAIEIKGIDGPVRSYLVLRAKPRASYTLSRGLEGIETPLVGRDAELGGVCAQFKSAVEERRLHWVTVTGEPGVGKSRLALEFIHWLERRGPASILRARPQPYGNNNPYGLLRDLLASRFEILDSDPQATAKAKLAGGLAGFIGERGTEHTALIGQLIGLDYGKDPNIAAIADEGKQIRDRAFHAVALYLRSLHRNSGAPVILVLDDLHWADEGSLGFIDYVRETCADLPLFLLCMSRPTVSDQRPLWATRAREHLRIDLPPLSSDSTGELIEALLSRLEAVPAALRDVLASRAEGNPYFVEELISMLIDDGVIFTDTEPWRVSSDKLRDVRLPSTLVGVLQARIDTLPAREKDTLKQASVVGHVFWDEVLLRIAPSGRDSIDDLTGRELIYRRDMSAFEGTREFVFKHHVLHQVAYESVLKQSRRELHRQTADWLVVRSGDRISEFYGLIAEHYERAGDNANAVVYLRRAGEDAARSYVHQAALDYIGRALALAAADDVATRFDLLSIRRMVYSNTGRRSEQEADVAELERLAEKLDDDAARARVAGRRAGLALLLSDYPGACKAGERAVRWAQAAGAPSAAFMGQINWARALQYQGDYANAQIHTERLLALACQCGDKHVETVTLMQLGILAFERGWYGVARKRYHEALDVARAIGDRVLEGTALNNVGNIERLIGNYDAAFERFQTAQRLCSESGQRMIEAYVLCSLAQTAYERGDAADAIALADHAAVSAKSLNDRVLEATLLCVRGHALTTLGDAGAAIKCYRDSATLFRELGRATMPPEPISGFARVAMACGDLDGALRAVGEIIEHFDSGGSVDGTEDPIWIYLTCYKVLSAARSPRAREFLERGHAVLQQRGAALDAAERQALFTNVRCHREIVVEWTRANAATSRVRGR